jgi:transcriptional regulator with PAS, ATPase and Fis domain
MGRDIPVLITGETGTGKELLAQAIHNDSPRASGPFVAVNCASITETLIESELFGYEDGAFTGARKKGSTGKILQANGGSLFLDEIGDMPLGLQARLLRVLQERLVMPLGSTKSIPVNVSLICATNRNLRDLIAKGGFREDLYYRLNGLVVRLPPLRERTDLEVVITKLLTTESHGEPYTVSPEVMDLFKRHNWPGNFRQLTNLLRTAMVMADADRVVGLEHLPEDFLDDVAPLAEATAPAPAFVAPVASAAAAASGRLEDVELLAIQKTLEEHRGNVSAAARALGVSRNTIYRKLQH